jgi:uncharacterized protein YdaU (DUF1376 family)
MSKDPAFLFYPNDYIGGTMGMTFEEKGAYIELLMMQFNRGHMTEHMIGQTVGQLWVKLKDKFVQDSDGLWYNVRLELEQKKRKQFTDSRKNNLEGNNQYSKKEKKEGHKVGHMTAHMENENEIEDCINAFKEKFENSESFKLAKLTASRNGIKGDEFERTYQKWIGHFVNQYPDYMTRTVTQLGASLTKWILNEKDFNPAKKKFKDPATIG